MIFWGTHTDTLFLALQWSVHSAQDHQERGEVQRSRQAGDQCPGEAGGERPIQQAVSRHTHTHTRHTPAIHTRTDRHTTVVVFLAWQCNDEKEGHTSLFEGQHRHLNVHLIWDLLFLHSLSFYISQVIYVFIFMASCTRICFLPSTYSLFHFLSVFIYLYLWRLIFDTIQGHLLTPFFPALPQPVCPDAQLVRLSWPRVHRLRHAWPQCVWLPGKLLVPSSSLGAVNFVCYVCF